MTELSIEIIDTENEMIERKKVWEQLLSECIEPTIYSGFTFVHTAWRQFKNPNDELFIIVVKQENDAVAIAPFRIEHQKFLGLPSIRIIRFIAEWGEGDKPRIISKIPVELVWKRIYLFLHKEYRRWDSLYLLEQNKATLDITQYIFNGSIYSQRSESLSNSYFISMAGSWDEYVNSLGSKTRQNWRKCRRLLEENFSGISFERFGDSSQILQALDRYILLEQSGWKKGMEFSVGGNDRVKSFYKELIDQLALRKMVSIHFLTDNHKDISSAIIYHCKDHLYGAHIAYDREYSKYSPGIMLNSEIIKSNFQSRFDVFDLLGLQNAEKKPHFKKSWATGEIENYNITINRRSGRMIIKSLVRWLEKLLLE
jgi:CelD/BcsL family acetyltransferase involved in cellulose biosynthesis